VNSIPVRAGDKRIAAAIKEIDESKWARLQSYPEPGLAEIAHNLARWTQLIGLPGASPRMLQTFGRRRPNP